MRRLSFVLSALALFTPTAASAQVTQPNGLSVPQPSSTIGEISLQSYFDDRGEAIDATLDASATPDTFSPLCGFTATFVLNQAGEHRGLAWYNATGASPAPADLHVIVPAGATVGTMITGADIRSDAAYLGGEIGFALVGGQTHYSEARWNPVCTACALPGPWITSLTYRSVLTENAYYLAFEDGAVSPASFNNDGDYNDDVFFVEGLVCTGGGERCSTGMPGICGEGVTDCGGETCRPTVEARDEECNGLDDDCDGAIDGDGLCDAGEVCDRGSCVPRCGGEFGCGAGLSCDEARGICIDPLCTEISCDEGEVCHAGTCEGPCDSITCPGDQICRAGGCFDACLGVVCPEGQVCDGGGCVLSCDCAGCGTGEACDVASGSCIDAGCVGVTCTDPQLCRGGECVDPCEGAVCPRGQMCELGACVPIPPPPDAGTVDSGTSGVDASATSDAGGSGMDGGTGRDAGGGGSHETASGCGCSVPRSGGAPPFALALVGLVLVVLRRRARR